jgi:hypothetical protein
VAVGTPLGKVAPGVAPGGVPTMPPFLTPLPRLFGFACIVLAAPTVGPVGPVMLEAPTVFKDPLGAALPAAAPLAVPAEALAPVPAPAAPPAAVWASIKTVPAKRPNDAKVALR